MKTDEENGTAVGMLFFGCIGLIAAIVIFLTSCGGPNQAYLQDDWPRFQTECVEYCAPEEAHPSRDTRPWLCGCPDVLDE